VTLKSGLRPVYSDTTQLDVELSFVAINGPLEVVQLLNYFNFKVIETVPFEFSKAWVRFPIRLLSIVIMAVTFHNRPN